MDVWKGHGSTHRLAGNCLARCLLRPTGLKESTVSGDGPG